MNTIKNIVLYFKTGGIRRVWEMRSFLNMEVVSFPSDEK